MTSNSPIDFQVKGYQLLDFGAGRKLERFGDVIVDRPSPQAEGACFIENWNADVVYSGSRVAEGEWQGSIKQQGWQASIDGQLMQLRLGKGGQVGVYPEHIACWRWIRERLQDCLDLDEFKVLNLFAGTGGATLAAKQVGAQVIHVDAQASQIELAKRNCGETGVRYIREDAMTYVERQVRKGERFDMVIMDPPSFGRGGKNKAWDIRRDFESLIKHLPKLVSEKGCGVWLSIHTQDRQAQEIADQLNAVLPGHNARPMQLGTMTTDGRVLEAGVAAVWNKNLVY